MLEMDMKYFVLVNDVVMVSDKWSGPKRICLDQIHTSTVSTVFLGIEHSGGMFETLVMGGPIDGFMVRCHAAENSRAIHARVVEALNSVNWLTYHLDGNVDSKLRALLIDRGDEK